MTLFFFKIKVWQEHSNIKIPLLGKFCLPLLRCQCERHLGLFSCDLRWTIQKRTFADDNLLDGAFTSGPTSLPPRASPANPQSHLPKKNMSDLLGMEQESSFNRQQKNDQKPFLPSQLFDLDQSLYSNQSSNFQTNYQEWFCYFI